MICAYTTDVLLNGILLVLVSSLQPAINAYMTCELVEYRVFLLRFLVAGSKRRQFVLCRWSELARPRTGQDHWGAGLVRLRCPLVIVQTGSHFIPSLISIEHMNIDVVWQYLSGL